MKGVSNNYHMIEYNPQENERCDSSLESLLKEELVSPHGEIKSLASYRLVSIVSKFMYNSFSIFGIPIGLDPIIGFVPIVGDMVAPAMALPMIYLAMFKIKSLPLTLAIILNLLIDVAIGIIPLHIGNIADFFNRAYVRNMKLLSGYIDCDVKTISKINKQAAIAALLIGVLLFVIYILVVLVGKLAELIGSIF